MTTLGCVKLLISLAEILVIEDSVWRIAIRVQRKKLKKIPVPPDDSPRLFCDSDRIQFWAVRGAAAVNQLPSKSFVTVEVFSGEGGELDATLQKRVPLFFLQPEPLRLKFRVVQVQPKRHLFS